MIGGGVKISIYTCFIVVLTTMIFNVYALNQNGSLEDIKIYFPYDESQIDPNYMENHTSLHIVDSLLNNSSYISTLSRIEIVAQSSPEGKVDHNEELSKMRKVSLEEYFTQKYPQIDPSLWSFKSIAENWELFHQHLVEDLNLPSREEVLAISNGDRDDDAKEWLIKKVDGGAPWLYIKEHILPSQRFGASVLFIPIATPEPTTPPIETPVEQPIKADVEVISEPEEPIQYIEETKESPNILFALKTNLLLDLVTAINLGVEIPLGDKFSVVGEVVYPWWRNWDKNLTMQIESYHGELKYWLGERTRENRLTGWVTTHAPYSPATASKASIGS